MNNLSEEVLNFPTWKFESPSTLYQLTLHPDFHTLEEAKDILDWLSYIEGVRPEDLKMRVEFK